MSKNYKTKIIYRYRFTYISVGAPGRIRDCYLYEISGLKKIQETNPLFRQYSKRIKDCNVPVFLIGDSAFALTDKMMKPIPFSTNMTPQEIHFNKRLSSTRRVVENAFGHLKARFRKIGKGLDLHINHANTVIKGACVLHNFLNNMNDNINKIWVTELL